MCNYLISNKEELKDLIYFFGILISVSISFFSLIITIKNRRNQHRESLYKEQINFASKLSAEFYNIHYDLIRVNKGNESNIQMATTKIENIFELIFSNSYLISNELIIKTTETVELIRNYLKSVTNENKLGDTKIFECYLNGYRELTSLLRSELGVEKLNNENKKLIK